LLQDKLQCLKLDKIDTYYRSNSNSKKSLIHHEKVIVASYLFFKKYLNEGRLSVDQKKYFRYFIILFLIKHIFPFQKEFKESVNKIIELIKKSQIFNFKELKLLFLYKIIIKLNLHRSKGLGVHKLTKVIKRQLKYD
jgi:hypothetical protein